MLALSRFSLSNVFSARVLSFAVAAAVIVTASVASAAGAVPDIESPIDIAGTVTAFALLVGGAIAAVLGLKMGIMLFNMAKAFILGRKVQGG